MRPISNEKREIIINAKLRGETDSDIAQWLNISKSSVTVIWRLYRETNSIDPKPYKGAKPVFIDEMKHNVRQKIKEQPDITLEELIEELDLPIKKSRLAQWLREAGYTYKKKRFTQTGSLEMMCKTTVRNGEWHKTREYLTLKI